MWFKFPDGVDQIAVEQQNYKAEVEQGGKKFFRAPDHFAARILDLPGFTGERPQGEGVPVDLPTSIPGAEGAVSDLTAQLTALKETEVALRETIAALTQERDKAVAALKEALDKVEELSKVEAAPKK